MFRQAFGVSKAGSLQSSVPGAPRRGPPCWRHHRAQHLETPISRATVESVLSEIDLAGHIIFSNDRIYKIMGDSSANTVEALMSSVVVAKG